MEYGRIGECMGHRLVTKTIAKTRQGSPATHSLDELVDCDAVCRTAPASLGLSIIVFMVLK